jgi:arylsulfatase A-like enzyme
MIDRVLVAAFLSSLSIVSAAAAEDGKRRLPNIIWIMADDLGYGDVGCYGQKQIQTPNIDALAKGGIRFTQCYAGSTVCAPSRCCLMTGYHTGHARIRGNDAVPLRPEDLTVAELLKKAGYTTALCGKWGLGDAGTTGVPTKKGFDSFCGYLNQVHAHNYFPEFLWRNETKALLEGNVVVKGVATKRAVYSPDLIAKEALEFIDKNKDRPFFLYFAMTLPHANNEAGKNGMEIPSDAPYTDKPWPQAQKNHAAMISRVDADVGRVVQKLKDLKLDENTIVFFTSDNGPHKEGGADPAFFSSAGPLSGYKRSMTEGGIRIPMIARWPGRIKPGVSDQVWAFWDFLPTAAELAGAKAPDGIDGVSVVPALLGKGVQQNHEFLYWEFHEGGSKQAVRMGDWKAIVNKVGERLELYDLGKDIGEANNLADRHPEIVKKVDDYLKTARTESEYWPLRAAKK